MAKSVIISRDESFARLLASGKPIQEAYLEAGFSNPTNATRKKNTPAIKLRVAELLKEREAVFAQANAILAGSLAYDRQTIIAGLFDTIKRAKENDDLGVVRACYVDLGKEIGMFVDRSVNVNVNVDAINSISDSKLIDIAFPGGQDAAEEEDGSTKPH